MDLGSLLMELHSQLIWLFSREKNNRKTKREATRGLQIRESSSSSDEANSGKSYIYEISTFLKPKNIKNYLSYLVLWLNYFSRSEKCWLPVTFASSWSILPNQAFILTRAPYELKYFISLPKDPRLLGFAFFFFDETRWKTPIGNIQILLKNLQ